MTLEEKKLKKIQKKEIKEREKKEKKELEEAFLENREVDKKIKQEISDIKRKQYIEEMTPIWEERRRLNEAPKRGLLEEIGNSISHGLGVIFAIIAIILLLKKSDTGLKVAATLVYGFSMLFMFLNSCLYHSWRWGSTVKRIWRRFDYTSIYLLIAGTFAPLQLIELPKEYGDNGYIFGITYFIIMWLIVITGITLTCIFGPGRIKKVNFPIYFVVGWSGVSFLPGWIIYKNFNLLYWILFGGVVYTLGMIPFALFRKKPVAHFIWHIVVFLAVIIHFLGLYLCVY